MTSDILDDAEPQTACKIKKANPKVNLLSVLSIYLYRIKVWEMIS